MPRNRRNIPAAIVTMGTAAMAGVCNVSVADPIAAPVGHQPAAVTAVLATVDAFMSAISSNDLEAMARLQMPEGTTFRARAVEGGDMEVVARPNAYWVDPARKSTQRLRERYWSPTVLIRGSIAVVWAPYEFHVDGARSHCGIDVVDLVRVDGAWRVANMMWTVEPAACEELGATAKPGGVRPAE